ncbi:uridine kinase family protein [Arcticibacterium luteifluviistationis]|uniref:Phosphoribulokinase/uridine kinase domain-containing protein n=1 Tax=Arcticibacterium luteifluviistationis TaxID=1784714 RepID=A0A2Z4GFE0_9BACT|nr:hypothetical protein [Arcticibacterium luteifluviistationis]AWV99950.1 hypothetical protein DJ013_17950 [Arcticibacterium luteifluviistationis]
MKENLNVKEAYKNFALKLFNRINQEWQKDKLVIGICGESGSGKTVTGLGLKEVFESKNHKVTYLQMDDYFHLPPHANHENRLKSFDNVGQHEVNLKQLEEHIHCFLNDEDAVGQECDFTKNKFVEKLLIFKEKNVLIVEGTYLGESKNLDVLTFIDRDYKQTLKNRIERGRESFDPFIEKVLEIEHHIIKKYKKRSDIIIDPNYNIENTYA